MEEFSQTNNRRSLVRKRAKLNNVERSEPSDDMTLTHLVTQCVLESGVEWTNSEIFTLSRKEKANKATNVDFLPNKLSRGKHPNTRIVHIFLL